MLKTMFNPDISGKRTLLLFIIVLALIAWLPKPAIADEILWEYSNLSSPRDADRLPNGNTLITDGDNYRVIEVTVNGIIVWEYHWSDGLSYMVDADRLSNGNTLITDIGHFQGVIEVTPDGEIVWQYSTSETPWDADRLSNGNNLITIWGGGGCVIEVTTDGTIVWEYNNANYPRDADRLQNGNTLICDGDNHRIIEVTPEGTIVWECSTGPDYPYDVDRLPNGNTLISELYYGRVIEVTTNGTIVWQYGNLNLANDAERLPNGNTLICDRGNNRVIEVGVPGAIEGTVTDAATGVPIAGAIVSAHNTYSYFDTTDDGGYYLMPEVIPGTYDMTVTMAGYNQFDSTDIVVVREETTEVNFALTHPEIETEPDSLYVELIPDSILDTTIYIMNNGNGPLDFSISIGGADISVMSIELKPITITGEKISSNAEIDNFYSQFAMSPISERPSSIPEPSAGADLFPASRDKLVCLPAVPIPSGLWKAGRTYCPTGEDTIHYDGENYSSIGLTNGGTFEAAIRLTPEELAPYAGWQLISALFYHFENTHSGQLKIYGAGSSSEPGALLTSETYGVTGIGWFRIDLTEPVTINALQDLWTSVEITHAAGEYPIGCDEGPAVQGKGDFIYPYSGGWGELYWIGLNCNWNIRAIVAEPEGWLSATPTTGTVLPDETFDVNIQFDATGLTPDSTYHANLLIYNNSATPVYTVPVTLYTGTVGIDGTPQVPKIFALAQNYPNPFSTLGGKGRNPQTKISYTLPNSFKVLLKIYNIKGQLVETLVDEVQQPGYHSVIWNVPEKIRISPGVYLYRIIAGNFTDTKKCVILK